MKVFWWQGGLHIQPESDVENEALLIVWRGIHGERPAENAAPRKVVTDETMGFCERGTDLRLGDDPC